MSSIEEIEQEVFRDIRTLVPRGEIRRDQRLIADLKLLSDDATAFALDMERKFAVKFLGQSGPLYRRCKTRSIF